MTAVLAHAAHDRAQVGRLDHDADPLRLQAILQEMGDLLGQPLLDLQPPCVGLDDARDLREADDPAPRDVGHGGGAEERQQVMLAERVERDVLATTSRCSRLEDRRVDQRSGRVVDGSQLGVMGDRLRRPIRPRRRGLRDLEQDLATPPPHCVVGGRLARVSLPANP